MRLGFTDGFGNAGRLYERLRKRSLRSLYGRQSRLRFIGKGRKCAGLNLLEGYWNAYDHAAYIAGLRDGIKGTLNLAKTGDLN